MGNNSNLIVMAVEIDVRTSFPDRVFEPIQDFVNVVTWRLVYLGVRHVYLCVCTYVCECCMDIEMYVQCVIA